MSANRLWGPSETLEVILCQYEDGRVFYQFNGLSGTPAQPADVHRLLASVAHSVLQAPAMPPEAITRATVVHDPLPTLYPQEWPS